MHVLAVVVLEITIVLERDNDIQFFLNGDLCSMEVDLNGTLKWSCGRTIVVQGERHQRSFTISH